MSGCLKSSNYRFAVIRFAVIRFAVISLRCHYAMHVIGARMTEGSEHVTRNKQLEI